MDVICLRQMMEHSLYMQNRGYLWGRYKDSMKKIKAWMFENGPEIIA
jgi:hypothetical protein